MIEPLSLADDDVRALAELLIEATANGFSVGFMEPLALERAEAYWRESLADAKRVVLGARERGRLVGTVTLALARPENQPHRADVQKLLVARSERRRGLGERLMREVESLAARQGRTLLVLDTATPEAARLYQRMAWQRSGEIPDYALMPDGALTPTVVYWKRV